MKCALEIMAIKEEAEKAYALEQARLDEECKVKYAEIIAVSFAFCEEVVGAELEECAKNRNNLCYRLKGVVEEDRLGNKLFCPLYEDGRKYANGNKSYTYNSSKTAYSIDALTNYLEQFCYTVKWNDSQYMRYGCGCKGAVELEVTIK